MAIQSRFIDYHDDGTPLRASLAWDDSVTGERPGILVSHAWRGRSEFEDQKARDLAELGYVGFALDVYGRNKLGSSPEENAALMQPFIDDRAALQQRLQCGLQTLREAPEVNANAIAGIGFCFGGLCMLDLARSGTEINGVVSFHGLLHPPQDSAPAGILAKVLVLHGWDDPMATPQTVLALSTELTTAGADWQLHAYGNTMHAFTNPAANDAAHGLLHEPRAERRAWQSMRNFLQELFQ